MIGFLSGKILHTESPIVLNVAGVGYEIFVPERILPHLKLYEEMSFHIVTVVKDDAIELLGFETSKEKNLYKLLTSIDGVGPKSGLNILGQIEPDDLIRIMIQDEPLPKFKGAGKTVSERLNSELRTKIKKNFQNFVTSTTSTPSNPGKLQELKLALIDFGYNERSLQTIHSKWDMTKDLTSLIKDSLQLLKSSSSMSGVKTL